jgi:hypothetical protein
VPAVVWTVNVEVPEPLVTEFGLNVHDDNDYTIPLGPGSVFTIEPGIYIPEESLGVRIEDILYVDKDGKLSVPMFDVVSGLEAVDVGIQETLEFFLGLTVKHDGFRGESVTKAVAGGYGFSFRGYGAVGLSPVFAGGIGLKL